MNDYFSNKKTLYRHIVRLQAFSSCWLTRSIAVKSDSKCVIYECVKLYKDKDGNKTKYFTYLLSRIDELPEIELLGFSVDIHLMSSEEIKSLIYQCNEYGIECKPYEEKR